MLVEKSIQIKGKNQLTGEIEISGAKNAVLKQMILPILCEGQYKIENDHNLKEYNWQKPHKPNQTGTNNAYHPNKNKKLETKKYKSWKN